MGCNQSTAKNAETDHQETQTSIYHGGRRDSLFEDEDFRKACSDDKPLNGQPQRQDSHTTTEVGTDTNELSTASTATTMSRRRVTHICLTGGPCAGKSSALADLQTRLQGHTGIKVFCVPEAATLMVGGGMEWNDISDETRTCYQLALLKTQLALEDTFLSIAKAYGKPAVVISDRGTMDGRAFCTTEQFNGVLSRGGFNLEQLRDRYDAVLHMVSAAKGAAEHYNMDNPARQEGIEGAAIADDNLRKCYIGHNNIKVFDNSTHFQGKLDRVFDAVCEICGTKAVSQHKTRRYICAVPKSEDIDVPHVNVTVTVAVLANSTKDLGRMVISRRQGDTVNYFYHVVRSAHQFHADPNEPITPSKTKIKEEHRITEREYISLLNQRDTSRVEIVKEHLSFMHEDTYYEVGVFSSPKVYKGKAILHVNHEEGGELPSFLQDPVDVTGDEEWSYFTLSSKDHISNSEAASPSAVKSPEASVRGDEPPPATENQEEEESSENKTEEPKENGEKPKEEEKEEKEKSEES